MIIEEKDIALARCRVLVEKKLQWGSSHDWTTQDFEQLSEQIALQTGVTLSATTLKRVWGKVKYDSVPTQTTLNALAQFLGYDNWRLFSASSSVLNGNGIHVAEPVKNQNLEKVKPQSFQSNQKLIIGIVLVIVAIAVAIGFAFWGDSTEKIDTSQVSFTSKKVSDDLPNSVIFNYNIGNIKADSVTIQQSWDPRRREKVPAQQQQHTSIYYYPGYFKAKLLINNQIVKEHDVFIKTKGWQGIIEQDPLPIYLSTKEIGLDNNSMAIDAATLRSKTSKTVFNDVWTNFYLLQDFDHIFADNFTLSTTLQNTSAKEEAICQQVKIKILTSEGAISLPLCSKGCVSDISVFLFGNNIRGKDHDLSAFGCDFTKPQQFTCEVKNRNMTVSLNEKPIFTATLKANAGKVAGVIIAFQGTGKVERVELKGRE